jgi:hypothetical protein
MITILKTDYYNIESSGHRVRVDLVKNEADEAYRVLVAGSVRWSFPLQDLLKAATCFDLVIETKNAVTYSQILERIELEAL